MYKTSTINIKDKFILKVFYVNLIDIPFKVCKLLCWNFVGNDFSFLDSFWKDGHFYADRI